MKNDNSATGVYLGYVIGLVIAGVLWPLGVVPFVLICGKLAIAAVIIAILGVL